MTRRWFLLLGFLLAFGVMPVAQSEEAAPPLPSLQKFGHEIETLLRTYYPDASVSVTDQKIEFTYDTMEFSVHHSLMTGEWQPAVKTEGPKRPSVIDRRLNKHGGILGSLELHPGRYDGQAILPQTFDVRYFKTLGLAPESAKHHCYLYAHLSYPDTVDPAFLSAFSELVNRFEQYLD